MTLAKTATWWSVIILDITNSVSTTKKENENVTNEILRLLK
jgi:hypothetical protein